MSDGSKVSALLVAVNLLSLFGCEFNTLPVTGFFSKSSGTLQSNFVVDHRRGVCAKKMPLFRSSARVFLALALRAATSLSSEVIAGQIRASILFLRSYLFCMTTS